MALLVSLGLPSFDYEDGCRRWLNSFTPPTDDNKICCYLIVDCEELQNDLPSSFLYALMNSQIVNIVDI